MRLTRSHCRAVRPMLWDHAAERLDPTAAVQVSDHLTRCAACREAANEAQAVVTAIAAERRRSAASQLGWADLASRVEGASRAYRRPRIGPAFAGLTAAVGCFWLAATWIAGMRPSAGVRQYGSAGLAVVDRGDSRPFGHGNVARLAAATASVAGRAAGATSAAAGSSNEYVVDADRPPLQLAAIRRGARHLPLSVRGRRNAADGEAMVLASASADAGNTTAHAAPADFVIDTSRADAASESTYVISAGIETPTSAGSEATDW